MRKCQEDDLSHCVDSIGKISAKLALPRLREAVLRSMDEFAPSERRYATVTSKKRRSCDEGPTLEGGAADIGERLKSCNVAARSDALGKDERRLDLGYIGLPTLSSAR